MVKTIRLGIRGTMINNIRSMYQNVRSRVKYNNKLSDSFECYMGVRQDECLSPVWFSMFLNDLEECFIKDARSISLYPYNQSQILPIVKYTK